MKLRITIAPTVRDNRIAINAGIIAGVLAFALTRDEMLARFWVAALNIR